jgi:pyridoxal phosphate enzyme (YggS family)
LKGPNVTTTLDLGLQTRIERVNERIAAAARRVGRDPNDIQLVAVCKTVDRAAVDRAFALGLRDFGENRVQDALAKFERCPADLRLHMIGTLQTNKARQIVGRFALVHSLDRVALADELDKRAGQAGIVQPVLIQVNVAREEQKHGVDADDLPALLEHVHAAANLDLQGLMTMAPLTATMEEARPCFVALRQLRDRAQALYPDVNLQHLSMGMTNDYPAAIEEGATLVRVGRAIFQEDRS